ncbi:MAG: transcription termination factor NusA [Elusimicrobia bacterium RIFOXYB2_FULL_48_7]|nr:MAG: transcription termination factor NusA [Elusimicrobia bacterium RIFOXYB2_FULL_48_7]
MLESKSELLPVLEQIEKEKGIKKEEILKVIEGALISAYKKHVGRDVNVEASVDPDSAQVKAFVVKKIVISPVNLNQEIALEDAKKIDITAKIEDEMRIPLDTQEFSRIAAQTAKQVIIQKIRESERLSLFDEFKAKEGNIISGVVYKIVDNNVIVEIGKSEGILPVREQVQSEKFRVGEHIKVLIVAVEKSPRGPRILLSRNRPELVKRLFENEVPEIYEKVVEIVAVAREPGLRSKIVVRSNNLKVDPVGACVGIKGSRVKPIIDELRGERIDLVLFSNDSQTFIASAFSPAKVLFVNMVEKEQKRAEVIVKDDMLSLAIGKRGANVNLVCKLTGWKIDVRSETQKKETAQVKATMTVEELSKLPGVGKKTAEVLFKTNWISIEKIAKAKPEDLTVLQGIGEKTAQKIIEAAKEYLEKKQDVAAPAVTEPEKPKEKEAAEKEDDAGKEKNDSK